MTDDEKLDIPPQPGDDIPPLSQEQKECCFLVAKLMKKSCYTMHVIYDQDNEYFVLTCSAKINGQLYDCYNELDKYTAAEHADIFKAAFGKALSDYEKREKVLATLH